MPGIIGWIVGGYIGVLLLLFAAQRSLMFSRNAVTPDPTNFGVPEMQTVKIPTSDGLELHGWWRAPSQDDRPTIVYMHGKAGHIGDRAFKARHFIDAGYGVLLVSYRYNAGTGGKPSENGVYEDGRAAYRYTLAQGIGADRIVLYGESLGSGVVTKVASENPVGAVVLEAPYNRITDVAQIHYWYTPAKWILLDRFDSISRIAKIDAPLLILHGDADTLIPVRLARQLFGAAVEPKEAHFVPGGGHTDLYDFGIDRVILEFLNRRFAG